MAVGEGRRAPSQLRGSALVSLRREATQAVVTTTGNGKAWSASTALGWWRTFATLNPEDDTQVVEFVRRYGDPASALSPAQPVRTGRWRTLQGALRPFADAWTADPGISEVRPKSDAQVEQALTRVDFHGPQLLKAKDADGQPLIEQSLDRHGPLYRPRLLADFMWLSAADQLLRGARLRQCAVCSHWFELKRSTALHCSHACHQRAHLKNKESNNGIRS